MMGRREVRWGKEVRGKSESEWGEKQAEGSESVSELPTVSQENALGCVTQHVTQVGALHLDRFVEGEREGSASCLLPSPWRAGRCRGVTLSVPPGGRPDKVPGCPSPASI